MTKLHSLFKGSASHAGVFYPTGYLIAMFADLGKAREAENDVRYSGLFQPDQVLAVSGPELILHDVQQEGTAWTHFMAGLSRMFGTEQEWGDRDLRMATDGAALLAVHCPTVNLKKLAWERVQRHKPLAARYYATGLGGIEHLAGDE